MPTHFPLCQLTSHYANSLIMPTHSLCQLTHYANSLIMPTHSLCQLTHYANSLIMPTHSLCQLTHYANSLIMPTHSLCQLTHYANSLIMPTHSLCQLTHYANSLPTVLCPSAHLISYCRHSFPIATSFSFLICYSSFILCSYYANFLSLCHAILLSFQLPAEWKCSLSKLLEQLST